jgi:UDP-N-acetylmuramate: L-alanyl-gamma-D-glutamyl-meso-diaminopimelate ligase
MCWTGFERLRRLAADDRASRSILDGEHGHEHGKNVEKLPDNLPHPPVCATLSTNLSSIRSIDMTADQKRPFPDVPTDIDKIHIIGICGTAMGSLAGMLQTQGYTVKGSDAAAYPPMSTWLEERNIPIMKGYDASNLDWEPDLVIVGNVCREEYADAAEMRRRELPYMSLPEALKHFFFEGKRNLVITGTHGKTTTTGMLAWILAEAHKDPSFMIGGITGNFGTNYRLGDGPNWVLEGDEYDTAYFDKVPKFWHYSPYSATINNIEFDHADIYNDLDEVLFVFRRFAEMVAPDGTLWVNGDDTRCLDVSEDSPATVKTFGLGEDNDLRAENIEHGEMTTAEVVHDDESLGTFEIPIFGDFNVRNMLGATAMALDEGVKLETIKHALKTFKPVAKRQQHIGTIDDIDIYDDFAHHPTAVESTLEALRERFPERRIWVAFEAKSNTSRRRVFQHDYPPAFAPADHVVLSRPWKDDSHLPEEKKVDIEMMVEDIRDQGPEAQLIPDVEDIIDYFDENSTSGDIIIGLSGSSFDQFHTRMKERLEQRT